MNLRIGVKLAALACGLWAAASPAHAQRLRSIDSPHRPLTLRDTFLQPAPDDASILVGGVLGGIVGFGLGLGSGALIETSFSDPCGEWCGWSGALLGAVVGEGLGVALGAHLANDRNGSLLRSSVIALGTTAVGVFAFSMIPEGKLQAVPILLIPVVQLALVMRSECKATPDGCRR